MPRGRHRHAPPLHRMLAPAALAATALTCAGGAWVAGDGLLPRALATGAAATALVGVGLLRRWDRTAGRRLAEAQAARRSMEWQVEERCAELEEDLEESRRLRAESARELRAKRAEFERLRTEHAALLRRYAHAESDRATALEGRRQLAITAAEPAKALPPGRSAARLDPAAFQRAFAVLERMEAQAALGARLPDAGGGFDYFAAGCPEPAPPRPAANVIDLADRGAEESRPVESGLRRRRIS
ncbi:MULTISPECIES: hypothetical protein [unclassified Streptomyces]|uniref:hypothetical protein n=1 Tax=unclassified Streptomyces TaxID=2593676 RepID=UPI0022B61605|nr:MULTISPECIES: hypothetical protein [unclassified Streptomyces]MCZ7415079.1 hypothetical protein [Streptomyces sp. WMMC897]MCZ7432022.1 hypothetical protein [Streptomyces sp. WMMC1477]